jgi:hypothetical protein
MRRLCFTIVHKKTHVRDEPKELNILKSLTPKVKSFKKLNTFLPP